MAFCQQEVCQKKLAGGYLSGLGKNCEWIEWVLQACTICPTVANPTLSALHFNGTYPPPLRPGLTSPFYFPTLAVCTFFFQSLQDLPRGSMIDWSLLLE